MTLDRDLLGNARALGARVAEAQHQVELAKADYHHAIRRLHFAGGSLREIAEALQLSHQRVHQIIDSSGGTRGWRLRKKATIKLACSFCGLDRSLVGMLISGPGIHICDSCITLADQVVRDHRPRDTDRTHLELSAPTTTAACSFCGKKPADVPALITGPGVRICDACLGLCNEIRTEELRR